MDLWNNFQFSTFFSFIKAQPSNCNTIYTALVNSAEEAEKLGMKTCFVSFDQPLSIKARDILAATSV